MSWKIRPIDWKLLAKIEYSLNGTIWHSNVASPLCQMKGKMMQPHEIAGRGSKRRSRIELALQTNEKTTVWARGQSLNDIPKVALLARVSSLKQEKDGTIENQRQTCRELYERFFSSENHIFVGEFADEAYNLESKDEKRNFWKLMKAVQKGEVNTIITVNIDRIFRGATKQLNGEISDIFTHAKLELITTSQRKKYDPTDITSRMVDGFLQELGPTAKLEMVSKLQTARRRHLVENEKWKLGIVPFGYRIKTMELIYKAFVC
ncbi:MAG: recombinase family protein [Proteobacteria bacterium]|nr:MAG: recombinase family protein [Pseudomonadota bacterium]